MLYIIFTGKDWDKIIPQNDIDRVEEEERQKALLELNLPPRQRTTIQQVNHYIILDIPPDIIMKY
jgi:hypothetical protein